MPLDIATMFASTTSAPKTMTTASLRKAESQRDARAAASRKVLAEQTEAAARNAERVAAIKAAGLAQHASDIEALAKTSGKAKKAKAAVKAKAAPKVVKAKTVKAKAVPKVAKAKVPVKAAKTAPIANAPAAVTAMTCDVRCGMNAEQGMFIAVSAGSIIVVMANDPAAAPTLWHPSEVVAIIGAANADTVHACWGALDTATLLLAG